MNPEYIHAIEKSVEKEIHNMLSLSRTQKAKDLFKIEKVRDKESNLAYSTHQWGLRSIYVRGREDSRDRECSYRDRKIVASHNFLTRKWPYIDSYNTLFGGDKENADFQIKVIHW